MHFNINMIIIKKLSIIILIVYIPIYENYIFCCQFSKNKCHDCLKYGNINLNQTELLQLRANLMNPDYKCLLKLKNRDFKSENDFLSKLNFCNVIDYLNSSNSMSNCFANFYKKIQNVSQLNEALVLLNDLNTLNATKISTTKKSLQDLPCEMKCDEYQCPTNGILKILDFQHCFSIKQHCKIIVSPAHTNKETNWFYRIKSDICIDANTNVTLAYALTRDNSINWQFDSFTIQVKGKNETNDVTRMKTSRSKLNLEILENNLADNSKNVFGLNIYCNHNLEMSFNNLSTLNAKISNLYNRSVFNLDKCILNTDLLGVMKNNLLINTRDNTLVDIADTDAKAQHNDTNTKLDNLNDQDLESIVRMIKNFCNLNNTHRSKHRNPLMKRICSSIIEKNDSNCNSNNKNNQFLNKWVYDVNGSIGNFDKISKQINDNIISLVEMSKNFMHATNSSNFNASSISNKLVETENKQNNRLILIGLIGVVFLLLIMLFLIFILDKMDKIRFKYIKSKYKKLKNKLNNLESSLNDESAMDSVFTITPNNYYEIEEPNSHKKSIRTCNSNPIN